MQFPPFSRLFRVLFRGRDKSKVITECGKLADTLGKTGLSGEILGPSEAPIALISGNYRHQFLVRSSNFGASHSAISRALAFYKTPAGIYLELDVDPVSLL